MELGFWSVAVLFSAICIIVTLLLKKFAKAETYFLVSLIKTRKPLAFFDRMARHEKFLDAFAFIGLFLGFGALSIDFFYGRKKGFPERMGLFLASFAVLCAAMLGVDALIGNGLSKSALAGPYFPLMVASFGAMGLAGFTLFSLLLQGSEIISNYLIGKKSCPGVAPLVPGVSIPGVPITPPLHAWISLLIILLAHEGMHGILGRRHGFKIKSTGVLLLGPLPIGAFVEPEEKELSKAKDEKVLPFLAAGPMANLAIMAIVGLVLFGAFAALPAVTEKLYPGLQDNSVIGVRVAQVLEETSFCGQKYPSSAFGQMRGGDVIKKINGADINGVPSLFSELNKSRDKPTVFLMQRGGKELTLTLKPNELGQFGFRPEPILNENFKIPESFATYSSVLGFALDFLYWLFLLNFLVASINFLPMHPFDGGRMAKIIFTPYFGFLKRPAEETRKIIGKVFLYTILALLVVNALPLFI